MIDMTSWPELEVDVLDDVDLDPSNVRLEMSVAAPQADIMRDIFRNGDALSLVEGIIRVGYLTHEIPIVVDRDDQTIVVEGNRRLAALKAIQNPYLVQEYQSRIASLVKDFGDRDSLRTIRVKKAPDQDQANQLIAAIHTSNIRVRWKPARQAAFFQAQVDSGKTLPELLAQYPMSSVRRYVRTSQLLNKFKNADYEDPELRDFVNSKKFVTSTLARIYESAEFNRVLAVEMKPDGGIKLGVSDARFNRIATFIVNGMRTGAFTARTLPKTSDPRFIALIAEIERIATPPPTRLPKTPPRPGDPNGESPRNKGFQPSSSTQGGSSASGDGQSPTSSGRPSAGGKSSGQPPSDEQDKPSPARKPTVARLDPYGLTVPAAFPIAVHKIFDELIEIRVPKYPNATMDLLRTFLEKVIKAYARDIGSTIAPKHGGYVQLGDTLVWLNNHVQATPAMRA